MGGLRECSASIDGNVAVERGRRSLMCHMRAAFPVRALLPDNCALDGLTTALDPSIRDLHDEMGCCSSRRRTRSRYDLSSSLI